MFIGSGDGNVYALDLASGKKGWAARTGGPVDSSPLVLDGKVFFGSTDNSLRAVEAASGKPVWKYETGDKILGAPNWFVQPLTRPSDTLSPSDGERDGVRGRFIIPCVVHWKVGHYAALVRQEGDRYLVEDQRERSAQWTTFRSTFSRARRSDSWENPAQARARSGGWYCA